MWLLHQGHARSRQRPARSASVATRDNTVAGHGARHTRAERSVKLDASAIAPWPQGQSAPAASGTNVGLAWWVAGSAC
jgi:hypothetical protein